MNPGENEHSSQDGTDAQEAVAVVGMAGRFPMAPTVRDFWENLRDGRECLETLGEEELRRQGVPPSVLTDPSYIPRAGTLTGIEDFDAGFFGFAPSLAATMDPQQRLLLECSWHALEDAACDPYRHEGAIGVFLSGSACGYYPYHVLSQQDLPAFLGAGSSSAQMSAWSANDVNFYATRVAHAFDLHGPALSVQTACSSALVSVHLACQSLLCGESDMALAGGISVKVPHRVGYVRDLDSVMSPDGHCRPFDARAGGTVFTSGGGVVALKRLDDALRDGDPVRAVIRGSAVNNDGSLKMGYTAPSVQMQAEVVKEALALAGTDPLTIGYVEAHGTGTALGDPVEVAALRAAFGQHEESGWCALGSVKGNVGHCETAAGVVGLIKTVLCLENRTLVPTLHFTEPHPELQLKDSPFRVQDRCTPWPEGEDGTPRRACVTSLGAGGTNAHVVLEEAPARPEAPLPPGPQVLTLSARTAEALREARTRLAARLRERPGADLAAVSSTLSRGRRAFDHRHTLLAYHSGQAAEALDRPLADAEAVRVATAAGDAPPPVMLLFPAAPEGDPGLPPEGFRALCEAEPVFARHLEEAAGAAGERLGVDLFARLLDPGADAAEDDGCGPALVFCAQYALAHGLSAWGVSPSAVAGRGVGEVTAACLAGVVGLEDAAALVARRPTGAGGGGGPAPTLAPPSSLPFLSAAHGGWLGRAPADPDWWLPDEGHDQRSWAKILGADLETARHLLLEAGPGQGVRVLPDSAEGEDAGAVDEAGAPALDRFRRALGRLWEQGVDVDWSPLHPGRVPCALPGYPFQRARHWVESAYAHPADGRHETGEPQAAGQGESPEAQLAALWAQTLGITRPDPRANFFTLGGDSVMAAQMSGRARSAGLRFSPRTVLQNPTLEALTRAVTGGEVQDAEASAAAGPPDGATAVPSAPSGPALVELPLTPPQLDLLADAAAVPGLDAPLVLRLDAAVGADHVRRALHTVLEAHDALRVRMSVRAGLWETWLPDRPAPPDEILTVAQGPEAAEPSGDELAAAARAAYGERAGDGARAGLGAVLLDAPDGAPRHLVLAPHAALADRTTQRLLVKHLTTALRWALADRTNALPPAPTSWARWAGTTTRLDLDPLAEESAHWLDVLRRAPGTLPVRDEQGRGPARRARLTLDATLTSRLRTAGGPRRPRAATVLLAALAGALAAHAEQDSALVEVLGSARTEKIPGMDLDQALGCFTAAHPVLLPGLGAEGEADVDAAADAVADVPFHGLHYGTLRHFHPPTAAALSRLPAPRTTFTDQGTRARTAASGHALLVPVPVEGKPLGEPALARGQFLDIRAVREDGRVHLDWWYDPRRHTEEAVRALGEHSAALLRSLTRTGRG